MSELVLVIDPDGTVRSLYTDKIPLRELGKLTVDRASQIEFDHATQTWYVEFPDGRRLTNFASRDEAIACEVSHLNEELTK